MMEATHRESEIIRFPGQHILRSARVGATYAEILVGRFRTLIGRLANRAAFPGAIKPMEFEDKVTGQHIAVSVGDLFVRLSVSGRDYFFNRLTGRFDGTGKGCDC